MWCALDISFLHDVPVPVPSRPVLVPITLLYTDLPGYRRTAHDAPVRHAACREHALVSEHTTTVAASLLVFDHGAQGGHAPTHPAEMAAARRSGSWRPRSSRQSWQRDRSRTPSSPPWPSMCPHKDDRAHLAVRRRDGQAQRPPSRGRRTAWEGQRPSRRGSDGSRRAWRKQGASGVAIVRPLDPPVAARRKVNFANLA